MDDYHVNNFLIIRVLKFKIKYVTFLFGTLLALRKPLAYLKPNIFTKNLSMGLGTKHQVDRYQIMAILIE